MPFSKLGLSDQLVQGILATGYTAPTDIQSQAIPIALSGRDIIGCAQTGTGKTAAFVLPILHRLEANESHRHAHVKALVLTPTRELAQQIENSINGYGRYMKIRACSIYGGVDIEKQLKILRRGVDIVIATPGRLLDHLGRKSIDLSKIDVLVLDEADRMFDMGFINDVRKIISHLPSHRQTLLFSATMSKEVRALTTSVQKHPHRIEIGEQRKPVETVTQYFYYAPQEKKMDLLLHILAAETMDSVLIFSRTKHGADKISHKLERKGIKSVAIHSNRTQGQRQRALAGFRQGHFKVLVATDIAARGIDVEGISHVVNFDTPNYPEDYIHRIGRTGRAEATGDSLTFVAPEEMNHFKRIEHFVGKKFDARRYPGFDYATPPETILRSAPSYGHSHGHPKPFKRRRDNRSRARKEIHFANRKRSTRELETFSTLYAPDTGDERHPFHHARKEPLVESDWRSLMNSRGEKTAGRKRKKRIFKRA